MRVFSHDPVSAPSSKIFVQLQLGLVFPNMELVLDPEHADIVVGNSESFRSAVAEGTYKDKFSILFKPHNESDIRLLGKNVIQKMKSVVKRLSLLISNRHHLNSLHHFDIIICDSRRLYRLFNGHEGAVYLPLSYFEKKVHNAVPLKDHEPPKIVFFGEVTHLLESLSLLRSLDEIIPFKISLICFTYGPFSREKFKHKFQNINVEYRDFHFDLEYLADATKDIAFGLCLLCQTTVNYNRNSFLSAKFQPNEVSRLEKFSTNSGRAHLLATLGIPFLTHPTEDICHEFGFLKSYNFIESVDDVISGICKLSEPASNQKARASLRQNYMNEAFAEGSKFIRDRFWHFQSIR